MSRIVVVVAGAMFCGLAWGQEAAAPKSNFDAKYLPMLQFMEKNCGSILINPAGPTGPLCRPIGCVWPMAMPRTTRCSKPSPSNTFVPLHSPFLTLCSTCHSTSRYGWKLWSDG